MAQSFVGETFAAAAVAALSFHPLIFSPNEMHTVWTPSPALLMFELFRSPHFILIVVIDVIFSSNDESNNVGNIRLGSVTTTTVLTSSNE